jgi:hypothetical protein
MNISKQLGLRNVAPAEVKSLVKSYLSRSDMGQWLLIYDNTDDLDMWMTGSNASPALKSFLPPNHQGYIIFTTRNRQLAVKLASPTVIKIPEMDKATAINTLRASLVQKDALKDREVVTILLQQLTFLPLAITQAAAYINQIEINLTDYVSLLKNRRQRRLNYSVKTLRMNGDMQRL